MLIAHRLASSNEPDIKKILDNTIILLVPSLNPDGVDIIKNWYDKTLGTPYEGTDPPELYHKYVGHDNNRDWYAFTQVETQLTSTKFTTSGIRRSSTTSISRAKTARGFSCRRTCSGRAERPEADRRRLHRARQYMAKTMRRRLPRHHDRLDIRRMDPARAYSHYHGGVRILSQTASAKLATPSRSSSKTCVPVSATIRKESPNFGPVWKGGEWHLRDITNYMTRLRSF
jgi:hypothetical protein